MSMQSMNVNYQIRYSGNRLISPRLNYVRLLSIQINLLIQMIQVIQMIQMIHIITMMQMRPTSILFKMNSISLFIIYRYQ